MFKFLYIIIFFLLCQGIVFAAMNENSLPRRDLSHLKELVLEKDKVNPIQGEKVVQEYGPLTGHGGDCESQLPFNANARGELTLSDKHFIGGKKSCRWNYASNDVLTFDFDQQQSLSKPVYEVGTDSSKGKAAFFYTWIYNDKAIKDKDLYVKIYSGKEVSFEFPVYLDFTGWRILLLSFDEMKPNFKESSISKIEFYAPGETEGTLYFDNLVPVLGSSFWFSNKDDLTPWRPQTINHWGYQWYWDQIAEPTIPDTIAPAVQHDLDIVYERVYQTLVTNKRVKRWHNKLLHSLEKQYEKYQINVAKNGVITGKLIGLEEAYFELMDDVATAYLLAPKEGAKNYLKLMYINLVVNLIEQGFAKGHGMGYIHHYGYRTSAITPSILKMKDVLLAHKLYQPMQDAVLWMYGVKRIFNINDLKKGNADDFYTLYNTLLEIVQVINDSNKRSVYMAALSHYYNFGIDWRNDSAIKKYGAHYHHDVHYPAYASRGLEALARIGIQLKGTRYKFNTQAHESLKTAAILGLRSSYPDNSKAMWSLGSVGRHGEQTKFSGYNAEFIYNLAVMGSPDGKQVIDEEMSALYKSYFTALNNNHFTGTELIDISGNWAFPHGRNMAHSKSNWTAIATGSSKAKRNVEAFGPQRGKKSDKNANITGLLQAFGRFEIYYHNQSFQENGFIENGYNWSHRDGITAPDIPVEKNILGKRYYGAIDGDFANGVSLNNDKGVFATQLDNNPNADLRMFPGEFSANKSWFFFDDYIVALGSNINYKAGKEKSFVAKPGDFKQYPVQTSIFQKHLAASNTSTYVNETKVTSMMKWQGESNEKNRFIDPIGTGYIIRGNAKLHYVRKNQQSFGLTDLLQAKPLNADYATLLIDHGAEPKEANYEYVIVPNAKPTLFKKFEDDLNYVVHQQDSTAHIVENRVTAQIGMAFFKAFSGKTDSDLIAVNQSCLVMLKHNNDASLNVSVAAKSFTDIKPISFTVKGHWSAQAHKNILTIDHKSNNTIITVASDEGMTTQLLLHKI